MSWLKKQLVALVSAVILYLAGKITKDKQLQEEFKTEQDKLHKEAEEKHNAPDYTNVPSGTYTL